MPFTKCPVCGYNEVHGNSKITNYMSEYVDKVTGEVDGVFASVDPQLTVKDKVLVRKDLWVKPAVPTDFSIGQNTQVPVTKAEQKSIVATPPKVEVAKTPPTK